MADLPTVELIDNAFYWIKPKHEPQPLWTIAKWEVGSFWGLDGKEVTPSVISGPIQAPLSPPADVAIPTPPKA